MKPTMQQTQRNHANEYCGGAAVGRQTEGIARSPATSTKEVKIMDRSKRNSRSCLVNRRFWPQGVGGFTLMELLVVISMLTLLLGILLPGLQIARKKALELESKRRLGELAKAFQMYADDNGGRYPLVTDPNQTPQQIREKLLRYVGNEEVFYCPVTGKPYDFCVTYDPKTTLSNVRLDLISQPHRILLGGESGVGTHKDDMLYVITGAFEVVQITKQEWFQHITTPRS